MNCLIESTGVRERRSVAIEQGKQFQLRLQHFSMLMTPNENPAKERKSRALVSSGVPGMHEGLLTAPLACRVFPASELSHAAIGMPSHAF